MTTEPKKPTKRARKRPQPDVVVGGVEAYEVAEPVMIFLNTLTGRLLIAQGENAYVDISPRMALSLADRLARLAGALLAKMEGEQ